MSPVKLDVYRTPWYDRRVSAWPKFAQVILAIVLFSLTVTAFVLFVFAVTDALIGNAESRCVATAFGDPV